jgi:hypothetical protein
LEGEGVEEEDGVAAPSVGDMKRLGVDLEQRHERLLSGTRRER